MGDKPKPAPTPTPAPKKKPWEEDIFKDDAPKKAEAPAKDTTKPKGPGEEAGDTLRKLRKRNEELVKLHGEKGSSKARQPVKKRDPKRKDSKRR